MGLLAESKSRRKISTDPNNTKWTRDTNTFGQKILRSQGWQPGEYLGAKDAPHSEFHTAANASYIKVALKDDMKGLGFKKSKEDEITGLDVFSDVLSRLNGKSEDAIAQDQQARLVVKTSAYIENRWGPMRFVRGGLLVGDELKETTEDDASNDEVEKSSEEPAESPKEEKKKDKKDKKSKKRKAASLEEEDDESPDATPSADVDELQAKKRRKEERKARKNKEESRAETSASDKDEDSKAKKREKKEKKDKASKDASRDEVKKSKKERKEEKKEKKKEKKKRRKEEAETEASESDSTPSGTAVASDEVSTAATSAAGTGTSTPRGSRNFVRSRFIAQKKAAVLDTKLLNQIFMVKA